MSPVSVHYLDEIRTSVYDHYSFITSNQQDGQLTSCYSIQIIVVKKNEDACNLKPVVGRLQIQLDESQTSSAQ